MIERVQMVVEQPKHTPKFTVAGFKATKQPPLLRDALVNYFEHQKGNYAREVSTVVSSSEPNLYRLE